MVEEAFRASKKLRESLLDQHLFFLKKRIKNLRKTIEDGRRGWNGKPLYIHDCGDRYASAICQEVEFIRNYVKEHEHQFPEIQEINQEVDEELLKVTKAYLKEKGKIFRYFLDEPNALWRALNVIIGRRRYEDECYYEGFIMEMGTLAAYMLTMVDKINNPVLRIKAAENVLSFVTAAIKRVEKQLAYPPDEILNIKLHRNYSNSTLRDVLRDVYSGLLDIISKELSSYLKVSFEKS